MRFESDEQNQIAKGKPADKLKDEKNRLSAESNCVELGHLSPKYYAVITSNSYGKESQNPLGKTLQQLRSKNPLK